MYALLDPPLLKQEMRYSIDFDNGRAGIYHGTVSNVSTAPSISANIISNDDEDFGYPSIVYTGLEPEEQDGSLLYSHTGLNRFPGHSAIYFDQEGEYSDPLTLREGTSYIDELPDDSFSFERWGDYSMAQTVVDAQGRPIHVIHDGSPKRQGKLEFTMSTAPLEAGMYFLQINADGKLIGNEKIIVQ